MGMIYKGAQGVYDACRVPFQDKLQTHADTRPKQLKLTMP